MAVEIIVEHPYRAIMDVHDALANQDLARAAGDETGQYESGLSENLISMYHLTRKALTFGNAVLHRSVRVELS